MVVSKPDFRKGTNGEIGLKLEMPDFSDLSLKHTSTPHFTFITQNTPSSQKIEQQL